jgi:hypothetical protein
MFAQQQVIQGQRMPRLTTEQRSQIDTKDVKAEGLVIYNTDINCLEFWDGTKWRSFCESKGWFYMPSIVIDVEESGTFSRDLYLEYKKQFSDTDNDSKPENSPTAGTPMIKSDPNAPNPFSTISAANELYFYVIGYDATVFSNISITPAGVMTYTVDTDNVSDATYMNIVFVVK